MQLDKPDRRIGDLLTEIEKMDLDPVLDQNFVDQDIYLDGREFVNCNFKNCRLFCHIGHWRVSGEYHVEGCGFHFKYPASVVWDTTIKLNKSSDSS